MSKMYKVYFDPNIDYCIRIYGIDDFKTGDDLSLITSTRVIEGHVFSQTMENVENKLPGLYIGTKLYSELGIAIGPDGVDLEVIKVDMHKQLYYRGPRLTIAFTTDLKDDWNKTKTFGQQMCFGLGMIEDRKQWNIGFGGGRDSYKSCNIAAMEVRLDDLIGDPDDVSEAIGRAVQTAVKKYLLEFKPPSQSLKEERSKDE